MSIIKKNGNLSHRGLITRSEIIVTSAKRDEAQLATMGITPELTASLQTLLNQLVASTTHANMLIDRKAVTQERDVTASNLIDATNKIRKQARLFFMQPQFATIYKKGLTRFDKAGLINFAETFLAELQKNASSISIYAVTEAVINNYEELLDGYRGIFINQIQAGYTVANAALERNQIREQVYQLAQHFSSLGQTYWKKINPVRAAEYSLYETKAASKSAQPSAPSSVEGSSATTKS